MVQLEKNSPYNPFETPQTNLSSDISPLLEDLIPADRSTRFVANLVDQILYLVAMVPGIMLGLGFDSSEEQNLTAALAILSVLPLFAYQSYLVAFTGQSLAKKWFKIQIVRWDGSPPGFFNGVLVRSWVSGVLGSAVGCYSIVDAVFIFGDERRCLHDYMAGTKVIKIG